jgi:hypothetical protein
VNACVDFVVQKSPAPTLRICMGDRGEISELWEEADDPDVPYPSGGQGDDAGEDGVEAFIDNYERLQRQNARVIAEMAPANAHPPAPTQAATGVTGTQYVTLITQYRADYEREVRQRYGDLDESSSDAAQAGSETGESINSSSSSSTSSSGSSSCSESRSEEPKQGRKRKNASQSEDAEAQSCVQRLHRPQRQDECFLCGYSDGGDAVETGHHLAMVEIIKKHHGTCSNLELARMLHLYFKKEVYDARTRSPPMLTVHTALLHIEVHVKDARIKLGMWIEEEEELKLCLKNRIFREDGSFDPKALAAFRQSRAALCRLYMMDVTRMNFNNGNNADDLKRQANYFQLEAPRFERKPAKQPAQRGRRKTSTPKTKDKREKKTSASHTAFRL